MSASAELQKFIFPPRPGGSIMPGDLDYYERTGGWLIQPKYNESRILTHVLPDGQVVFWTRHATRPTPAKFDAPCLTKQVLNLNIQAGTEYWLDGGVMNREKGAGGELVFFDILCLGNYLFLNKTQKERLKALGDICGNPKELNPDGTALRISDHLWMAPFFSDSFTSVLRRLVEISYVEGVVLRKLSSQIDNYGRKQYEVPWMKRCRVK